jgi:membrane-associated phospholipid phosphatase
MRNRKLLFPLILLAIFVGLSRVYIGVHFPFDVVSGAVFGTLIGVFVAGLDLSRLQERMESGWKRILRPFRFEQKE